MAGTNISPYRDVNIVSVNGTAVPAGASLPVTFSGSTKSYTTATSASVALSTASALALAANASAVYRIFQNKDSAITVTLGLGNTPTAGVGIVLPPGAAYEMSAGIGNLFQGIVNAIAASGTPALAVTEGV